MHVHIHVYTYTHTYMHEHSCTRTHTHTCAGMCYTSHLRLIIALVKPMKSHKDCRAFRASARALSSSSPPGKELQVYLGDNYMDLYLVIANNMSQGSHSFGAGRQHTEAKSKPAGKMTGRNCRLFKDLRGGAFLALRASLGLCW